MGDPALQGDGVILGMPWRFVGAAGVTAFAMLHHGGGALERAHLADPSDVSGACAELQPELEVLVRIKGQWFLRELWHYILYYAGVCPASCWIWRITNSAGFSGAKPTRILTMPRSISDCVLISESHFTR